MASYVLLLLAFGLSQFYRAFLAVISGDLSRDLGVDAPGLASLSAAWLLAFAAAQFPIGLALDRFGPRRTMSAVMSCAAVGAAWLGLSTRYGEALGAFVLIGIGCAPALMGGFYVIARTYPVARFAFMSSMLVGFGALGDPLSGVPLAGAVAGMGWRGAVLAMAAVTALVVAGIALILRDPPRLAAGRSPLDGVGDIVRLRALWPILPVAFVSYAVVITIRSFWIAPYLAEVQGLGAGERSVAATGMGLAMAAGSLLFPLVASAVGGVKRTVLLATTLTACLCVALAAAPAGSPGIAIGILFGIGGAGLTYAMIMTHARSFMPAHALGAGVTLMNLVFMGGAGLVQWASGRVVSACARSGLDPASTYSRLFVGLAVALLASGAVYGFTRPERTDAA